ncbi:hypothetical protein CDAR_481961 [Caerostris darwini]|uniref:Uncharacterized protein n=1 Tax=Caerostris darwini TaxID=1538125 RepID=A0AAV4TFE9_9ARAC|nr:hypothetical protein CDAR_481961 [Caerostris darwini]
MQPEVRTTCSGKRDILEEKDRGLHRKLPNRHLRSLASDLPPFYYKDRLTFLTADGSRDLHATKTSS